MSDFDSSEKKERQIWNVIFYATDEQCRAIERRKLKIPCYKRWALVDYLVKCGRFHALDPKAEALCSELVDLDIQMSQAMLTIIEVETANVPDGL